MKVITPYKIVLIVFLSMIFKYTVKAQNTTSSKTDSIQTSKAQRVFIEVGAAGLFYSVNYDTRFSLQRNGLGGRLGIGYWHSNTTTFITAPLQISYLFGNKHSFFELGAGATLLTLNKPYRGNPVLSVGNVQVNNSTVLPTTTIGYRYQPLKKGISFGVSFNPMLLEGTFIPDFGASMGYAF